MRRRILSMMVFCCILPAQTKKVIANLPPEMMKDLAVPLGVLSDALRAPFIDSSTRK